MKVLFAGPSLFGLIEDGAMAGFPGIVCRPPAGQGDIARAVLDGAAAIGLVDGRYEDQAAPWHKEILWAIQNGVAVLGGASLGALRAVECAPFGMIGVGEVFRRYASGELVDDSDVAQLHGPAELGSMPLTEAFVNVEATILRAQSSGGLAAQDGERLIALAREIFFKELTLETVAARAEADAAVARDLLQALRENYVDQKRQDALALADRLANLPDRRSTIRPDWALETPAVWLNFLASVGAESGRL